MYKGQDFAGSDLVGEGIFFLLRKEKNNFENYFIQHKSFPMNDQSTESLINAHSLVIF